MNPYPKLRAELTQCKDAYSFEIVIKEWLFNEFIFNQEINANNLFNNSEMKWKEKFIYYVKIFINLGYFNRYFSLEIVKDEPNEFIFVKKTVKYYE